MSADITVIAKGGNRIGFSMGSKIIKKELIKHIVMEKLSSYSLSINDIQMYKTFVNYSKGIFPKNLKYTHTKNNINSLSYKMKTKKQTIEFVDDLAIDKQYQMCKEFINLYCSLLSENDDIIYDEKKEENSTTFSKGLDIQLMSLKQFAEIKGLEYNFSKDKIERFIDFLLINFYIKEIKSSDIIIQNMKIINIQNIDIDNTGYRFLRNT